MSENPLLSSEYLPLFKTIEASHINPALDGLLDAANQQIEQLEQLADEASWENFAQPLEDMDERIDRVWSTVSHLHGVKDSAELREAYNEALQKLTEFHTTLGQNLTLFKGYKTIQSRQDFADLSEARQRIINNAVRDFQLSGAELDSDKKRRFKEIQLRLSELSTQFEQQLLDATQSWHLLVTDKDQLAGLPDQATELAAQTAHQHDQQGWRFGLDIPSYLAIMKYADNGEIRKQLYEAYSTRASEKGPDAEKYDNGPLINEIIELRHEKAELLGFQTYAELALVKKMANSPDEVDAFLQELKKFAKPKAEQEIQELIDFCQQQYQISDLSPWDYSYYSEKLRQHEFAFSSEETKPYFPVDHVINGLFLVTQRLFGITVKHNPTLEVWDDQARGYDVLNDDGQIIGQLFADLFVRQGKRGGAWMASCRHRRQRQNLQHPVAYLTCNFAPGVGDEPALLTHDEVETLFHEFGHTLHHLLTTVDEVSVAGINGVAWDAVELPSQFLENWCWHPQSIALISQHYQTGEPLPEELLQKMLRAKHFQAGMQTVRQLEFAMFDMTLHNGFAIDEHNTVQSLIEQIRNAVAVIEVPSYHRFQNSFAHIFAGGYAAGYYSYKWAEVLSADAFSRFEEEGIFSASAGQAFLQQILQRGGVEDAGVLFRKFRGREPDIQPLLRQTGLISEAATT